MRYHTHNIYGLEATYCHKDLSTQVLVPKSEGKSAFNIITMNLNFFTCKVFGFSWIFMFSIGSLLDLVSYFWQFVFSFGWAYACTRKYTLFGCSHIGFQIKLCPWVLDLPGMPRSHVHNNFFSILLLLSREKKISQQ